MQQRVRRAQRGHRDGAVPGRMHDEAPRPSAGAPRLLVRQYVVEPLEPEPLRTASACCLVSSLTSWAAPVAVCLTSWVALCASSLTVCVASCALSLTCWTASCAELCRFCPTSWAACLACSTTGAPCSLAVSTARCAA